MGSSDMKRRETLERRLEEKGLERQAIPRDYPFFTDYCQI